MKLRDYLELTKQKPSDFATKMGVAHNTVLRWLSKSRTPTPAQMRAIYEATSGVVTPNDLVLA